MNLFKAKNIPIPCGAIRIAFPHLCGAICISFPLPCGVGLRGWVDFVPTATIFTRKDKR